MQEALDLATHLADVAAKIAKQYFRAPFDIIRKGDDSPVTIADRAIEKAMRELIKQHFPQDGILGEEFGTEQGTSGRTWVLDPIDGTKSFVMGRPTFGTLIALWEDDAPLLGIIDQPITGERWIGVKGSTSTLNGKNIQTRLCPSLNDAVICSTTPAMFNGTGPAFEKLANPARMAWGGDCYAYGLLASGHVDLIIEADLSPYDFAALVPIINGAGGHISDWQGTPLTLKSCGQVIALGDPSLWQTVKEKLN